MSVKRKCTVVMLPTKKATRLYLANDQQLWLSNHEEEMVANDTNSNQHLYIISDDEIKEGDWVLGGGKNIAKVAFNDTQDPEKWIVVNKTNAVLRSACKKIIATTDLSLINNDSTSDHKWVNRQLPQPSQSFIQKYVDSYNNDKWITERGITDIMVEYFKNSDTGNNVLEWEELKINSKDNTITITRMDTWDDIFRIINDTNSSSGTKEAMIRERYNPPTRK